jgi:hypothetical protein
VFADADDDVKPSSLLRRVCVRVVSRGARVVPAVPGDVSRVCGYYTRE